MGNALHNVVIVLSHTTEPRNIGAAARAMKTMGLRRLRLVSSHDPRVAEAFATAHGAEDLLAAAEVFPDVPSAVADVQITAGTTSRRRQLRKSALLPPEELARILVDHAADSTVGLLFGTERTGLTNEEVDLCRYLSIAEMAQPQPSLNLAQAVMVYAWEIHRAWRAGAPGAGGAARPRGVDHPHRGTRLPSQLELETMYGHLGEAMAAVGYTAWERRKFLTYIRHLHMRAGIVDWELQIYHLLARRILEATGRPRFRGAVDGDDAGEPDDATGAADAD
jgi:tRNA (cytidine32/uridine32-2'-O)-methyltransferase